MAVAGLYRRILPSPPAIEFASSEGKQLFSEALQCGTMEGFFKLISSFQTQSEPAYCGLASLSMVLNALSIDPGRKWKGPWRWFDESMLDCCEPLEKVKTEGITFGKVACLAHCSGAKVKAYRTNQSSLDDFRDYIIRCTSSEEWHLIASYHRKPFKQTGGGHFSPIGGYHAGRDMALILDVARFKYPPHWVPLALLWEAMDTIDEASGNYRGFMLISKLQSAQSLLYTLSCRHESWVSTAKYLAEDLPVLLKSESLHSVTDVLSLIFESLPTNAEDFIKWMAEVRLKEEEKDSSFLSEEEKSRLVAKEGLLQQVQETKLFNFVREWLSSCSNAQSCSDKVSLSETVANVCYQGEELLNGGHKENKYFCCQPTCVRHLTQNVQTHKTTVSGTVISGGTERTYDMLVPQSPLTPSPPSKSRSYCSSSSDNCFGMHHPGSNDVFTILLLALPSDTWIGVRDENLLAEIVDLVSTEKLPDVLQEEVLHLKQQLNFLTKCKGKGDDIALLQTA